MTHLECAKCGGRADPSVLVNLCPACAGPFLVRYDLERVRQTTSRESLAGRERSLWRYGELLPVTGTPVTLGEGTTPLLRAERLGAAIGLNDLLIKDEGLLPTGTFKARGAAVGVTRAVELGARAIALPTAGNAGAAWAAYGSRAGIPVVVVMPASTPSGIIRETAAYGARVALVDGSIADAGGIVKRSCVANGWFDASTLKEPYRIEGKKTMGFEIAEQLLWQLPDVIVYPTGGGVGLIGMWKAFDELEAIGWIGPKRPRFVSVQAEGCAPIVKAFAAGATESEGWPNPTTFAAGLRVPKALGDFLILKILRGSAGTAIAVSDADAADSMDRAGGTEGLLLCPEGGAAVAGTAALRRSGWITAEERVVVLNTGSGLKYGDSLPGDPPATIERDSTLN